MGEDGHHELPPQITFPQWHSNVLLVFKTMLRLVFLDAQREVDVYYLCRRYLPLLSWESLPISLQFQHPAPISMPSRSAVAAYHYYSHRVIRKRYILVIATGISRCYNKYSNYYHAWKLKDPGEFHVWLQPRHYLGGRDMPYVRVGSTLEVHCCYHISILHHLWWIDQWNQPV